MLFQPARLAGVILANRILRSATNEGLADAEGAPTEALARRYAQLARGGVGAIVTGFAGVAPEGRSCFHRMLMIDRDELVPAYRRLVDAVHALGTPIFLQLAHCGRQTRSAVTGHRPVAPSALRDRVFSEEVPHALGPEEIHAVIDTFVRGAERAREAGFDGVQLHAAHGYLLSSFLSAHDNRRTDAWGGSIENRARVVREILERVRACAPAFPVLVKLNGSDGRRRGMRVAEAVEVARILEGAGCAGLEISCGVAEDVMGLSTSRSERIPVDPALASSFKFRGIPTWAHPLVRRLVPLFLRPVRPTRDYNVDAAAEIRRHVTIPVIAVGGIRTLARMREIVERGEADLVALSRPLIREPGLVRALAEGRQEASRCDSCSYCGVMQEVGPLRCYAGRLPASAPDHEA